MPTQTSSGLLFPANSTGRTYISLNYHRGQPTADKSTWSEDLPRTDEYAIFCKTDTEQWSDDRGNLWGLRNNCDDVLGSREERLCKFPSNNNLNDPWHGFPVSPLLRGDDDAPSVKLVTSWIENRVVTRTVGRRIQKQKI
jgi:hypothetical protein